MEHLTWAACPILAGYRLPAGKHGGILTSFQTKVNKKKGQKSTFFGLTSFDRLRTGFWILDARSWFFLFFAECGCSGLGQRVKYETAILIERQKAEVKMRVFRATDEFCQEDRPGTFDSL